MKWSCSVSSLMMDCRWAAKLSAFLCCLCVTFGAIHLENDLENVMQEIDLTFEDNSEKKPYLVQKGEIWLDQKPVLRRSWGVPDTSAVLGKVFHYKIPDDAFSGDIHHYEASSSDGSTLPQWLLFDQSSGEFRGLPLDESEKQFYIQVKAVSSDLSVTAKDTFNIEVQDHWLSSDSPLMCRGYDEDITIIALLLDADVITTSQCLDALNNLSKFYSIDLNALRLYRPSEEPDFDNFALAGPGNKLDSASRQPYSLEWQIGCKGEIKADLKHFVDDVRSQSRDGTLAEVIGHDLVGWHVTTLNPYHHVQKREVGSGDYPYDDFVDSMDRDSEPHSRIVPTMSSPVFGDPYNYPGPVSTVHSHRHQHGGQDDFFNNWDQVRTSPVIRITPYSTPVLIPVRPTRLSTFSPSSQGSYDDIVTSPIFSTASPSAVESSFSQPPQGGRIQISTTVPPVMSTRIEPSHSVQPGHTTSHSVSPTTDQVEYGVKNFAPTVQRRLPKKGISAGKAFLFKIPADTFHDFEDENTRNLRLIVKSESSTSLPVSSWLKFDSEKQELYGLPLDRHIGPWTYTVTAMDSEGAMVSDTLKIKVQQHKRSRLYSHKFSATMRQNKKHQYTYVADRNWALLEKISSLFGDRPGPEPFESIYVHDIESEPMLTITWSNDSLSKLPGCENESVKNIMRVMTVNENGDASPGFREVMRPEFTAKRVTYEFSDQCRVFEPALPGSKVPQENMPPKITNAIDYLNVVAGRVFRFRVPDDTFYDIEDGKTSNMKLTLLTIDHNPIPSSSWLQFDAKNQEFFGLPLESDVGQTEYTLRCADSDGATGHDALIIAVQSAEQEEKFNVEFSVQMAGSYAEFQRDGTNRYKVVDKIRRLYRDPDTRNIVVKSVKPGSVIFSWHNNSIPYDPCPQHKIEHLRRYLITDNGTVSTRLIETFLPEFNVTKADLMPINICMGEVTPTNATLAPVVPSETYPAASDDDYLITFIAPAVIISAMMLIAALIACCLYKKRRSGKMSLEENGFLKTKRTPVIFEDELDSRCEPTKQPIIMKNEKPPMPPEYSRSGSVTPRQAGTLRSEHRGYSPVPLEEDTSLPYQRPPPPFLNSRDGQRNNRSRSNPSYTRPPAYVPP